MLAARLFRRIFRRRVQLALFGGVSIVCLAATVALITQVFLKLDRYGSSGYDNIAWTTSRLELDHIKLLRAIDMTTAARSPEIKELRRRFDSLFSRIVTLKDSAAYRQVLSSASTQSDLRVIFKSLEDMAIVIDSGDTSILNNREYLLSRTNDLRQPILNLSARGVTANADRQVRERSALTTTLIELTILSILMLTALVSLLILFWQLYHRYRRRAQDNRANLNRLAIILNTSQDAVLVVSKYGRVIDTNAAANAMFDLNVIHNRLPPISELLLRTNKDGSTAPITGEELIQSCADGPNRSSNLLAVAPNNQQFPVELSADIAVRSGFDVCVCFIRDISSRVAAEAEIKAARDKALSGEKAKARFLGMMSHEMRTPLNGILGSLDLLDDKGLSEDQRHYMKIMKSSGQLLLNQINDALDITQADGGKLKLNLGQFDLDDLIEELVDSQQDPANARNCHLRRLNADHRLGLVSGDRDRLNQVLLNLISNAIKFTKDGDITIEATRLSPRDDMIEFQVADTGIGIDKDDLPKVFDDFVRVGSDEVQKTEGTGLGLGIARHLTTLMGGRIGAESVKDEGSLFWLTVPLPSAPNSPETATPDETLQFSVAPMDVLIVEDNENNRLVLKAMLESDGHNVALAVDGGQGVEMADARKYDLILMDISMPGMDGVEATRRIRESQGPCAETRIVALTAHYRPEQDTRLSRAGFDLVQSKPLRRADLQNLLACSQHVPTKPVWTNPIILDQLRDVLPGDSFDDLIDGFASEGQALLDDLPALKAGASDHLTDRLHRFAGTSATVGASALQSLLCRAETAAGKGDGEGAAKELSELPTLLRETLNLIRHHPNAD